MTSALARLGSGSLGAATASKTNGSQAPRVHPAPSRCAAPTTAAATSTSSSPANATMGLQGPHGTYHMALAHCCLAKCHWQWPVLLPCCICIIGQLSAAMHDSKTRGQKPLSRCLTAEDLWKRADANCSDWELAV